MLIDTAFFLNCIVSLDILSVLVGSRRFLLKAWILRIKLIKCKHLPRWKPGKKSIKSSTLAFPAQGVARSWEVSRVQQKAGGIKRHGMRAGGGDNKESMWLTHSDGLTWLWIFQTAVRCVITAQWEHSQHGARHVLSQDRTEHKKNTQTMLFFSNIHKEHISNHSTMLNSRVAKCFHQPTKRSIFHWHASLNQ